jgi:uncharacterized membrane protein
MSLEPWLHFAHIAGAVIWVGGGLMLALIGVRARRSGEVAVLAEFARTLSYAGLRVFTPAVVVVLVTGVWLVIQQSGDFTRLWVLLALGAFAVAFLIGAVYLGRSAIQLQRAVSGPNPNVQAAGRDALGRWITGYAVVLVVLVFALWDMVFKPRL